MSFTGIDNLVSIVLPLYNAEDTVVLSLQSILSQTYTNWEVIIINDGSTDKSKMVVDDFILSLSMDLQAKFNCIDQQNAGPSFTRNKGIDLAKGEFIAFLDSDDIWIDTKLQMQVDLAKQHPEMGIISGAFYHDVKEGLSNFKIITFKQLLFKNYFATPTVFIRKNHLLELDYYFDTNKKYSEDYDLWLRLLKKREAIFINKVIAKNALGKANFGQSGLSSNMVAMQKGEISNYKSLYEKKGISFGLWIGVSLFSYLKFIRRLCIVYLKKK